MQSPEYYLNKAADSAAQVDPHLTSPNPRVGCVVVDSMGEIIAQGAHQIYGGLHAEAAAGKDFKSGGWKDFHVFITLEPCHTFKDKKTGSCTDCLIALQPKSLTVGALDAQFKGQNLKILQQAGIDTQVLNTNHHHELNPFFDHWITTGRPYICLKVAQTLEGCITNGQQHITGEAARERVHQMRANYSSILTTTETIQADNPQLNTRLKSGILPHPTSDAQVIIMGNRVVNPDAQVFTVNPKRTVTQLKTQDLDAFINFCQERKIDSVMTECGGTMNAALIKAGLVDEIQLFVAPTFTDKTQTPSFILAAKEVLNLGQAFELTQTEALGQDMLLKFTRRLNH